MDNNPQSSQPPASTEVSTPVAASEPQTVTPSPQPPQKKSKLGLILGLVGGGLVLLIAVIIAVVVVIKLNSVSSTDYRDAANLTNDITTDQNAIVGQAVSATPTESEARSSAEKLKSSYTKFNTDLKKLGDLKAVKKDKDVKAKYDALVKKQTNVKTYVDTQIERLEKVNPALLEVSSLSSSTSLDDGIKVIDSATQQLKSADVSQSANKTYVDSAVKALDGLSALVKKDGKNASSEDLLNYYNEATKADEAYASAIRDLQSSADCYPQSSTLRTVIGDKISKRIRG